MDNNFQRALKLVLVHEGGWADHPRDPGGPTMKGVTFAVYKRHFGQNKTENDLRQISDSELEQIYRKGYWDKCHCDELPSGVDYAVFDAAVNSGPGRGAKWLQGAIGAKQDGGIGPKTLAKVEDKNPIATINDMCDRRLDFLQSLGTWSTFGRGWGRRVEGVRKAGTEMAGGQSKSVPSIEYQSVKNRDEGPWVTKLQEALGIQADGIFGADTEATLKAWQQENGLEPDGIAGRMTFRALGLVA